jgi:hypothetical protein
MNCFQLRLPGLNLKRIVSVSMPHGQPNVDQIPPYDAHALRLIPVRLLMPRQPIFVQPLGQDENAEWW